MQTLTLDPVSIARDYCAEILTRNKGKAVPYAWLKYRLCVVARVNGENAHSAILALSSEGKAIPSVTDSGLVLTWHRPF